jgi:hypothetical protein
MRPGLQQVNYVPVTEWAPDLPLTQIKAFVSYVGDSSQ